MKKFSAVLALLPTLVLASLSPCAAQTELERGVLAALEEYVEVTNSGDPEAVAALYIDSPATGSVGDGQVYRGWDTVSDLLNGIYSQSGTVRLQVSEVTVTPTGPGAAVAYFEASWSFGSPVQSRLQGAMTVVFVSTGEGWRVAHDHTSTLPGAATTGTGPIIVPGGGAADGQEGVQVTFLDVGQGDAVLIRASEGQTALIDAGPGVDLSRTFARWGVDTIDLAVASHPHADHIGGMWSVLRSVPVRFYMDNGQPHTTATYSVVMQTLRDRPEITYLEAVPRMIQLGSVTIHVLPLPQYSGSNLNNRSIGLVVEYGEFRAFLSGDSERPELQHFVNSGVVPDVTVLKAPHHGSDDAVSDSFLSVSNPELIVISVGRGNQYGHPRPSALYAYNRYAEQLLRTDLNGEVTVWGHQDGTYQVITGR